METHTQLRAAEEVSLRDYYQNLVRDLQKDLKTALGPIEAAKYKGSEGVIKELKELVDALDKHIKDIGEKALTGDPEAHKLANDLMKAKPVSVNAPPGLLPHLTEEQKKEQAEGQKASAEAQKAVADGTATQPKPEGTK